MSPALALALLCLLLVVMLVALWHSVGTLPGLDAYRRQLSAQAQRLIGERAGAAGERLTQESLEVDRGFRTSLTHLLTLDDDEIH